MSVILRACRHTKQRAIARALKKKSERQRKKQQEKLKKEAELQELEAHEALTKLWSFEINGEYYSIMLYLAHDKDTVDIFCNDDEVTDVMTYVSAEGATFDFLIGASYKARIACHGDPCVGLVHKLSIDGYFVPEAE